MIKPHEKELEKKIRATYLNKYFKPQKISLNEYHFYENLKPVEERFLKIFTNNDYNNENNPRQKLRCLE